MSKVIAVAVGSNDTYATAKHVYLVTLDGDTETTITIDTAEYALGIAIGDNHVYLGTDVALYKIDHEGTTVARVDYEDGGLEEIGYLRYYDEHVYAISYTSGYVIAKYDKDLNVEFRTDPAFTGGMDRMVVDSNGDLFTTITTYNPAIGPKKFSGDDGTQVFGVGWGDNENPYSYEDFDHQVYGIAIDSNDNIIMVGSGGDSGSHVEKTSSAGVRAWRVDPTETGDLTDVVVDSEDGIVVSDGSTLAKLDSSDGSTVWTLDYLGETSADISAVENGVADDNGNTYWTAVRTDGSDTSYVLAKVSSDGSVTWEETLVAAGSSVEDDHFVWQASFGEVGAGTEIIVGQPDDRYATRIAADAGSLLASQRAVPFDTSSNITFGLGTNIDQQTLYPLKEVTRDQDGDENDVLFYPRARQGQGERSYDGITILTLMERNYPPAIFDTTTNLGLGASATAQEIIQYVLDQWATRYDWFTAKTVPDLRTRVDGLPPPSGYGATTGLITDTAIAIRQDDTQQSMRQILDGLLSPFPGTIYYQDSEGELVIRPAYGPDADENPVTDFLTSDMERMSIGEPDAFNITNKATATATQYTQTEDVEVMQPAWFQIVSNHLLGQEIFTPQSNRLNLSGETTDDESTRQAESPNGTFSNENRPLPWPIQDDQLLGSGGITPVVTAAYYGSGGQSGAVGVTVNTIPLTGENVTVISVEEPDFDVTIGGRWDANRQRVVLYLGSPMRLESGGVSWAVEFTLNDESDAWAVGASLSDSFGVVADGDTLPAEGGGNAVSDSQDTYGILEATIDARVYGGLTSDQLYQIAKGYVQQNITPRATRDIQLGWKGSTKALFDRRGRLVGLPGDGEGLLTGVAYQDDFGGVTGGKTVRVEETVKGAAGALERTTDYLLYDDGTYVILDGDGYVGSELGSGGTPVGASVVTEYDLAVGNETNPYSGTQKAFPTATGWGADSEGARNGSVGDGSDIDILFVTNRDNSGTGSLRAAMEATGRRIIIPLVGGFVDVTSSITVTDGRMTFLGQFMPEGTQGLWLRNRAETADGVMGSVIYVRDDSDHIIVRYLGVPRGIHSDFVDADAESNGNAWIHNGINDTQHYAIWDHITTAFTTDNTLVHLDSNEVTIQNGAFLDAIGKGAHTKTFHHDFGPHLFGSHYCLFHANFMTRARDRCPMVNEGPTVVLGNYAYNTYILPSSRNDPNDGSDMVSGNKNKHDFVRNYHRTGAYQSATIWMRVDIDASGEGPGASIYMEGNRGDDVLDGIGWQDVDYRNGTSKANTQRTTKVTVPHAPPDRTAQEWRDYVHRWAGVKYVVDPDTGELASREWSLQAKRLAEGLARGGPSEHLEASAVEALYAAHPVDTWAIAGADAAAMEATFWNDYYIPWATANGYGTTETAAKSIDGATGYTPLELYMMSLTPVYDFLSWDSLSWSA